MADEILRELNNYGMDDEDLEEVLFEALETLETMLVGNDSYGPKSSVSLES